MATNIPVADYYGLTDMRIASKTYMWAINNFSYCIDRSGKKVYSPKFYTGDEQDHEWRIDVYPYGEDGNDNDVGVYIYLLNSYQEEIKAQYRFYILNGNGTVGYGSGLWSAKTTFCPRNAYGYRSFIKRDYLYKNAATLLPNDKLTIYCEVTASTGFVCSVTNTTTRPQPCPCTPKTQVCEDFHSLYQNGKYSDVTLLLKSGKQWKAHKGILATRSTVFATMFDEHAKNGNELHIVSVADFDDEIIQEILRFIYSGTVQNLQLLGSKIIAAAVRYDVKGLKTLCEESLINGLNINNAAQLLGIADLYKTHKLKAKAIQFIASNAKDVINTPAYTSLTTSHPHLITEVLSATAANTAALVPNTAPNKRKYNGNRRNNYNDYDDYDDDYCDDYDDDDDYYDDDDYDDYDGSYYDRNYVTVSTSKMKELFDKIFDKLQSQVKHTRHHRAELKKPKMSQ